MELSKFFKTFFIFFFNFFFIMGFGIDIKRLRDEANISAAKMAALIGVDAERLRKWEQKDLSPKDEDTMLIEAFFGIRLIQLKLVKKN